MSLKRKIKRQERFGKYLVLGLIIPYINSDECLGKLIRLNKASNIAIK